MAGEEALSLFSSEEVSENTLEDTLEDRLRGLAQSKLASSADVAVDAVMALPLPPPPPPPRLAAGGRRACFGPRKPRTIAASRAV